MESNLSEIDRRTRRIGSARETHDEPAKPPLSNTPALSALVVKEFKKIEELEEDIAERRMDIKEAIKRMVGKGLSKKGVKAALARRKLVMKGGFEQMDETLALICGIGTLGIQGELFFNEGNGAATNGDGED